MSATRNSEFGVRNGFFGFPIPHSAFPRPAVRDRRGGRIPHSQGFTLAEVVLGGTVLAIAVAAILGAYVGQVTLNEHARNLSLAIQDANRVIEQIRQQTATCGANLSTALIPQGGVAVGGQIDVWLQNGWDAWFGTPTTKSIQPDPTNNELVVVTCQDNTTQVDCDNVGTVNPVRVTVAICWRHRNRIIGECANNGTPLTPADNQGNGPKNVNGLIESPAMLTTLVTCRG